MEVLRLFDNFEVKHLFEDQVHERHQFQLNIAGDSYQGIFHEGEIKWFHPQPHNKLDEDHLQQVEEKVHDVMQKLIH